MRQDQPRVVVQFLRDIEGLADARGLRTGHGQRLTRAEHGAVEGGDLPVLQRRGPHGHFIDHPFEIRASRAVDAHAIALNLVHRTCRLLMGVDEHAIEVLAHLASIEHRDEVHPPLCLNRSKGVGLVVVQAPLAAERRVLEGSVGSCVIGHREHRGVIWQGAGVGPDPLADREVPVPIVDINVEVVVHAIEPEAPAVHAGAPIGGVHASRGQIRVAHAVGHRAARTVLEGPVVFQGRT